MEKNTSGKWVVYAFQSEAGTNPGQPVTGDAANITANIRIDGGAANAVDDTNPTELEDGYYVFDVTAAETNGDLLLIAPASSTANVNVIGVPGAVYTNPANFNDMAIAATTGEVSGDIIKISGDSAAADNIEAMYDGTGYTDDAAPATQAQLGALSVGSASISTQADSYTLTTGTQSSGTFADTATLDSVFHQHTDTAGALDLYYEFDVGGNGIGVEVVIDGYLQGANDSLSIQAYNWVGATWDNIGTLQGANGTTSVELSLNLLKRNTGTGANAGKVRIRFYAASGLTSATLAVDRIYASYSVVSQTVGYAQGAIWIDTGASNTNTESYVDGVADNPVSTIAAADTLNTALSLNRYVIAPGSSITLPSTYNNHVFYGESWNLALNGQDISDSHFYEAVISGTGLVTAGNPDLHVCDIGTCTLGPFDALRSGISGTITVGSAGTFNLVDCYSKVAGGGTPVLDAGVAVGASNFNFRRYSGGIEIQNFAAGDNMSLEGYGQLVINANCTGGSISVRGTFKITDNSSGAVALTITSPVVDQVHQGVAQAATANTITLAATASATNGQYDPGEVLIVAGAGAGQKRSILDYDGTTKVAVIDKDWRTNPDTTSSYVVFAGSGKGHVNEGQAQGGSANTITLNTSGDSNDDHYIGQTVFIVGGTGQDQSRRVIDYNGTTKVATVDSNWTVNPDATSSYIMMPTIAPPLVQSVVDGLLDEALSGHNTNGSLGKAIRQIVEGVISEESSVNDVSATVNTFVTNLTEATSSHYSDLTLAFISGNLKGQAKPIRSYNGTSKTIVLDEDLSEAPADGDGFIILTTHVHPVSQIVDTIYDRATAGHITAGTFGKLFADMLADTNELQTDLTDGGRLDLILDQIATDTTTDLPATIAALNNVSAADVLAQVNTALDTAISELGVGAPTATPNLRTGLMLLYMALRNRIDVDTVGTDAMKVFNDAGTQIASKAVTDDGATYSEAKMT